MSGVSGELWDVPLLTGEGPGAHAGGVFFIGNKYRVRSGAWTTPQVPAITPSTYAEGGLQFAEAPPIAAIFNGVRGTFSNPMKNYESDDFPSYQNATAFAQDGGHEYWLDLDLTTVTGHTQAQRLARIAYNKARYGFDAGVALQFTHFELCTDDIVQITDDLAGFTAKTFRVTPDRLDEDYTYTLDLEHEAESFYDWDETTDEQGLEASDPLLGDQGALQPPGAVLIDGGVTGGQVTVALVLSPSPSSGANQILCNMTHGSGSLANSPTTNTAHTQNYTPAWLTGNLTVLNVRAFNSATGEESPTIRLIPSAQAIGAIDGLVEASTFYILAPPKPPLILAVATGTVQLRIPTVPVSKSQQVELWENTVNNSGTATLVGAMANSNATFVRTGSPGQVKFYWARTKNVTDSKFSGFSNPTLVVF